MRPWAFAAVAVIAIIVFFMPLPARSEPLTLLDGLKIVTAENRVIRIKQQEEKMSHEDTVIARSKLLPSVNTSYAQTFLENQPGLRAGSWSPRPLKKASIPTSS